MEGVGDKLEGVGTVNMPDMPRWMQTSTTGWLHGCVSSFNKRSLWFEKDLELSKQQTCVVGKDKGHNMEVLSNLR